MRVVVAGYDKMFAALINGAKLRGHDVVGAFRNDRVKYSNFALFFKDIFNPSYALSFLKSHKIYDIKANSINSKEFLAEIKKLGADVILVGSWSEKFLEPVLSAPKYGVINCHPSLLPKHRGANPYFWAIYSGDRQTGVTFHIMDENFDTGKILMQAAFNIESYMTGGALKNKASKVAELMVGELLNDLECGKVIPVKQDENEAKYDKYPYDGIDVIDFNGEDGVKIFNKVRGLKPWGYCSCILFDGGKERVYRVKNVKIIECLKDEIYGNVDADDSLCKRPGSIIKKVSNKFFLVRAVDSILEIHVF